MLHEPQGRISRRTVATIIVCLTLLTATLPLFLDSLQHLWIDQLEPRVAALSPGEQLSLFGLVVAPILGYVTYHAVTVIRNIRSEIKSRKFRGRPVVESYLGSVFNLATMSAKVSRQLQETLHAGVVRLLIVPRSASGSFKLRVFRSSSKTIAQDVTDSLNNFEDAVQQRYAEQDLYDSAVGKTQQALQAYKQKPSVSITYVGMGNAANNDNIAHTGTSSLFVHGESLTFPEAAHRFIAIVYDSPSVKANGEMKR